MQKSDLRNQLKAARLTLPVDAWRANSEAINQRLKAVIDWSSIGALHYYEPIATLAEVDTNEFIVWLQQENPSVHCYTSRLIGDEWRVVSVAADAPVPTASFEAVLVPMLGFDASLHRIGYGGGYYDKFLASQPQAQKIGVCFELGRIESLPVESHDIALNYIVTEAAVYGG